MCYRQRGMDDSAPSTRLLHVLGVVFCATVGPNGVVTIATLPLPEFGGTRGNEVKTALLGIQVSHSDHIERQHRH